MSGHVIHTGDCLDILRTLPDASVHCCMTSPPYWGLRDYGHAGQIGLEETPEAYVARMVEAFREVRRVLRDDGTLWMNLGDSYASIVAGLKPKDLVGIPWRVALALQADGWWLRQDIIWHKPSPMPESVTDRCTKAHEYVFLLTKSPTYFFDAIAISEPSAAAGSIKRFSAKRCKESGRTSTGNEATGDGMIVPAMRNRRSVWRIAARGYSGAHFATMPPELAEVCIKSGTSERGCCPHCGSPWKRLTERTKLKRQRPADYVKRTGEAGTGNSCANSVAGVAVETLGWTATCDCPEHDPVPCVVLDPFAGSGTTLAVAKTLGRDSVGIELNPDYVDLAEHRIESAKPEKVRRGKSCRQMRLFDEGSP